MLYGPASAAVDVRDLTSRSTRARTGKVQRSRRKGRTRRIAGIRQRATFVRDVSVWQSDNRTSCLQRAYALGPKLLCASVWEPHLRRPDCLETVACFRCRDVKAESRGPPL